jgi:hypothetical protein
MKRILVRVILMTIALNATAFAGGRFIISLGQPGAHSDARAHDSAFVVRVYGCSAANAKVTATAEGLVNGERRSIPLEPVRLAVEGTAFYFAEIPGLSMSGQALT